MQNVDTMIHVNELLNPQQRTQLESLIREIQGVIAVRFNKPHLLLVAYDRQCTHSSQLLTVVKNQGYQAQLVSI